MAGAHGDAAAVGGQQPAQQWPAALRSSSLQDKIRDARVLCVGAGGIGCELLKTLVCAGFQNIEVIDLDTIETSNLNRQFLFRKHHVKSSKAQTAADMIRSFKPQAKITAHHANVKEQQFGVEFIRGFSLVLNGLDNLDARRHVNRLAMAANVPLVESGTAGYLGQVTVHLKGQTECFECSPKPVPKSFPVCTLRNTPDKPIHCVVWAKDMLFARMFGANDEVTDLDERPGGAVDGEDAAAGGVQGEGAEADEERAKEEQAKRMAREDASAFVRRPDEGSLPYAVRVFERIYSLDIERLVSMEELWKSRPPPKPLSLWELLPGGQEGLAAHLALDAHPPSAPTAPSKALGLTNPKEMWSVADNARVFLRSILHYHDARPDELGRATFDKDDDAAVEFVAAASNLRSACYGIPTQALFDAKGMAGNIIHAIATTNAVISGLIVAEALKLLAGFQPQCRATYLLEAPNRYRRLLVPSRMDAPRAGCLSCGRAVLTLRCDTSRLTLARLVEGAIKGRLGAAAPTLLSGDFMYEEGDGLEEDEVEVYQRMLGKPLASLPGGGLVSGALVAVTDEAQGLSFDLAIVHQEGLDAGQAPDGWVLEGTLPAPAAAAPAAPAEPAPVAPAAAAGGGKKGPDFREAEGGALELLDDEEEDVVVVVQGQSNGAGGAAGGGGGGAGAGTKKRAREESEEEVQIVEPDGEGPGGGGGGGDAKRAKVAPAAAAPVTLDDDDEVVILD